MNARVLVAVAIATSLGVGCRGSPPTASKPTPVTSATLPLVTTPPVADGPDVASLVARVSPSVVNITATEMVRLPPGVSEHIELFSGQKPGRSGRDDVIKRRGLGSGFILDAAGRVVTNAHVVENASTVRVTLFDEREFEARVIGRDDRLDLAVLALDGATDLPRAALGQSEPLRVGEAIVAIGNPFGLGNTVTTGIVSAKSRAIGAGPYDDFIQTDASINPGNSGGPLFNLKGEVVGISTAIVQAGQGIGFAIPVDALRDVLPQLLEKGSVSRGRLGLAIQAVDAPLAKVLGLDKPKGALVSDVEPGSTAQKAGIKPQDVILAVDESPVVHAHDLPRLIGRRSPGTRVTLTVAVNNASTRAVQVPLEELREKATNDKGSAGTSAVERPSSPAPGRDFGLEFGDEAQVGVVVQGVELGSMAADALEPGDVVLEVNGASVTKARDATTRLQKTRTDRPALLKINRNGRALYVALERK